MVVRCDSFTKLNGINNKAWITFAKCINSQIEHWLSLNMCIGARNNSKPMARPWQLRFFSFASIRLAVVVPHTKFVYIRKINFAFFTAIIMYYMLPAVVVPALNSKLTWFFFVVEPILIHVIRMCYVHVQLVFLQWIK